MTKEQLIQFFESRPSLSKAGICKESGISTTILDRVMLRGAGLTQEVADKLAPVLGRHGYAAHNMRMYKISHDVLEHDYYLGHIIVARTESEVIDIAIAIKDGCEPKEAWRTATIKNIGVYTGSEKKPFILLSDFCAG